MIIIESSAIEYHGQIITSVITVRSTSIRVTSRDPSSRPEPSASPPVVRHIIRFITAGSDPSSPTTSGLSSHKHQVAVEHHNHIIIADRSIVVITVHIIMHLADIPSSGVESPPNSPAPAIRPGSGSDHPAPPSPALQAPSTSICPLHSILPSIPSIPFPFPFHSFHCSTPSFHVPFRSFLPSPLPPFHSFHPLPSILPSFLPSAPSTPFHFHPHSIPPLLPDIPPSIYLSASIYHPVSVLRRFPHRLPVPVIRAGFHIWTDQDHPVHIASWAPPGPPVTSRSPSVPVRSVRSPSIRRSTSVPTRSPSDPVELPDPRPYPRLRRPFESIEYEPDYASKDRY
ncbi:hypothetical protein H6P81_013256 [Aristolochia fimbriata]|uniref:Uncharacterized protein n=1 Tax=Aristolochia fimbriata TaxID=158543 RepID=A0AAV7EE80_ARIFI|nr:hypothetical protein H6P81_013256 [Aristolochia fimbriata]